MLKINNTKDEQDYYCLTSILKDVLRMYEKELDNPYYKTDSPMAEHLYKTISNKYYDCKNIIKKLDDEYLKYLDEEGDKLL